MAEIQNGTISYTSEGKEFKAYVAAPEGGGPGVIVLHAWWGLTPVFQRLCDRLAAEGFTALAPDLYQGRTAATIEEAQALLDQRDEAAMQAGAFGAVPEIRKLPGADSGPLGAIGFSMGAAWASELTVAFPDDLRAAVIFYGAALPDFTRARAAYLAHFAEHDEWEPIEWVRKMQQELAAAGREAEFHFYPGVGHWFFEDNRPDAFDPAAASLAWKRTLDFLRSRLV